MKKMLTKVSALLFLLLAVNLLLPVQEVRAENVRADGSIEVILCEGESYVITHPGETWVIDGCSVIGTRLEDTELRKYSSYAEIVAQSNAYESYLDIGKGNGDECSYVKFSQGAGTLNMPEGEYMHQYWVDFKNTETNKVQRYYFIIYVEIEDIVFGDAYINGNSEIYMYEGETIDTKINYGNQVNSSFVTLTGSISVSATKTEDIDPDTMGPQYESTNNVTFEKIDDWKYRLNAVAEGDYYLRIKAVTDGNCILYYSNGKYIPLLSVGGACSETYTVKIRKKPTVTLASDFYMNVNETKDIPITIEGLNNLEGVGVGWTHKQTTGITSLQNGTSLRVATGDITGTVILTATYTDDVINNSTKHSPITLSCTLHVLREEMSITSGGVDILNNPLDVTGGAVSAVIKKNDQTHIVSVKSEDNTIADCTYVGEKLTIYKVKPGKTNIIITTITGKEYKIEVTNKAIAPVVTVNGHGEGKLTWAAAYGATKYDVYRADTINGVYTKKGTVTVLSYTDTTATYGKTYYYKVVSVAEDANYSSDNSNTVAYTRIPEAPIVESVVKSYEQYKVTVNSTSKYEGYTIYAGTGINPTKAVGTTTSNNATLSFEAGTWYIRARAYVTVNGAKVYSNYSENVAVVVSKDGTITQTGTTTKINTVTNSKQTASIKTTKVKLTVKKVKGAKKYQVKYSTSKKFKKSKTKKITSKKNKITIKKLKANKKYYYKYRTYKKVNGKKVWSKWSKTKRLK